MEVKPVALKGGALKKVLFFAESLAEICAGARVAPGRPLRWIIIANPTAGGFTLRSRWEKHRSTLARYVSPITLDGDRNGGHRNGEDRTPRGRPAYTSAAFGNLPALAACGLVPTQRAGSGTEIATALVTEAANALEPANPDGAPSGAAPFYLVVVAGGDGTGLEVLSVLFRAPDTVRSNMAVLRLPMGTGNDGADSHDLDGALDLLVKPSRVGFTPALRLSTAPGGPAESKGPFAAFNVLSVGLDAFVTHMANKMKKKSPGDFYKLWVNVAALLYDKLYKVDFLDVKAFDERGAEVMAFREKLLLIAVGTSGHRSYGSRKKILPDGRNVCALRQMPLLRKLALKELLATGEHTGKPEATLCNASRVEISGRHAILAQTDGEGVPLKKEDFPIVIELTAPVIPVLRLEG